MLLNNTVKAIPTGVVRLKCLFVNKENPALNGFLARVICSISSTIYLIVSNKVLADPTYEKEFPVYLAEVLLYRFPFLNLFCFSVHAAVVSFVPLCLMHRGMVRYPEGVS